MQGPKSTITAFVWVALIAPSNEILAQFASPRLLFAQQDEEVCNIRFWHEFASEAVILARTDECPESLFVDSRRHKVFIIDGETIRTVRIYPAEELDSVAMPHRDHKVWLDSMELRPDQHRDYDSGVPELRPIGIRNFDDGAMGVVMSLALPGDHEFHYLFRLEEDGWSIEASRSCKQWGCEEPGDLSDPFHSAHYLSTRSHYDSIALGSRAWPEERMVWHPNLLHSESAVYRNEAKQEISPGIYSGSILEIGLRFEGTSSVLRTYVRSSEHSDTLHTFNVDLSADSGPPKVLSSNQCVTSIAGNHILVNEFFRGRFELTDLSTGETVFSNLSTAAWID